MDFFLNFLFFEFSKVKSISTFKIILNNNNKVWSSLFYVKDSYLEYFETSRFCTILDKNLFRTSDVSKSVLTDSPFSNKF